MNRTETKAEEKPEDRNGEKRNGEKREPLIWPKSGEILLTCGGRKVKRFCFARTELKEYELKMLQYCDIKGLHRPVLHWQDEQTVLDFDFTAAETGERQAMERPEAYVHQLLELERILPEYLLTTEGLQVGPGAAAYFPEIGEWRFCYLPLRDKDDLQDLDFFRSLFQKQARLFLQMEMMKEDRELGLRDYLAAVRQTGGGGDSSKNEMSSLRK